MKFIKFLILIIFSSTSLLIASEIKIVTRVNNEIITNLDIDLEFNYLIALNNDLKTVSKQEGLEIAKNSIIREKIKINELKKYYDLDKINDNNIQKVLENFYQKLGINSENDFKDYLKSYSLTLDEVKEKIKIELVWNQLIGQKYRNQININENELKKKIKENKLNYSNIIEYDLSEIVFQSNTQDALKAKINEIKLNIDTIGFSSAANKFSISESSKFGGKIGSIKENQLSNKIRDELKKYQIGQITNPINIGSSFIILLINNKKEIEIEKDDNLVLKSMIEFEQNRQFNQFSQIYYNKIRLNSEIK